MHKQASLEQVTLAGGAFVCAECEWHVFPPPGLEPPRTSSSTALLLPLGSGIIHGILL